MNEMVGRLQSGYCTNGLGEALQTTYRFSFRPWNISTGADPFGPPVRQEMECARKLRTYKELGFDAVQFHDDDIVPADRDWPSTQRGVANVKKILDGEGLSVEIIAPRLWEDPRTSTVRSRRIVPPTGNMPSIKPGGASISLGRSAARTTFCGWPARVRTSARPRTPGRALLESSMPGTPSSSMTRTSGSWVRPSPTSPWTKSTCRPSAT